MRAHYLQHVPFEGLGSIESWLKSKGFEITSTRFFEADDLPEPAEIDLLVVMGGPMSVNDKDRYPWLTKEKAFIHKSIESHKAVLGICLGAQLIASSLGAGVFPNQCKEIGWFPIHGVPQNSDSCFHFAPLLEVFHWHGETFDLPPGATCIASSQGCKHQAFQLGDSVIGLQFHLETTVESAKAIVTHCGDELVEEAFVQSETEIMAARPEQYETINQVMAEVLAYLTASK